MNESVREYEELMSLYLEGKCTSEQEARLAAWVGEHPDNAHEYHRFRNVWDVSKIKMASNIQFIFYVNANF